MCNRNVDELWAKTEEIFARVMWHKKTYSVHSEFHAYDCDAAIPWLGFQVSRCLSNGELGTFFQGVRGVC